MNKPLDRASQKDFTVGGRQDFIEISTDQRFLDFSQKSLISGGWGLDLSSGKKDPPKAAESLLQNDHGNSYKE